MGPLLCEPIPMSAKNGANVAYYVEQAVRDLGVKIVFAEVEGFDNKTDSVEWNGQREGRLVELVDRWTGKDLHKDSVLEGFHILHDRAHIRRKHNVPAPVTLIKLLVKRGDAPYINKVVDIYNTISMETRLALGAHDLDRVEGDITLRVTDGSERHVPLGECLPVPVAAGEYSYCDDSNEVLCRLEVRQVNKTAITPKTTRAFFIVQGNEATPDSYVVDAAQYLVDEVTRYAGGNGRVVIPQTK